MPYHGLFHLRTAEHLKEFLVYYLGVGCIVGLDVTHGNTICSELCSVPLLSRDCRAHRLSASSLLGFWRSSWLLI